MLNRLKRWLGWGAEAGSLDFSDRDPINGERQPSGRPSPTVTNRATAQRPSAAQAPRGAKTERAPLEVLDNPRLSLDKAADDGFDPYNTGAFNRSASWDRISRDRKR